MVSFSLVYDLVNSVNSVSNVTEHQLSSFHLIEVYLFAFFVSMHKETQTDMQESLT